MNNLEPFTNQLDDMLIDLYEFRAKHHVWHNYTELWRKWLRSN